MAYYQSEKGVSLIVIFLIMTIMLAIVLSISVILSSQIKMVGNMGNVISSFYAAQTGAEEALYFTRKLAGSGLCNLCAICESAGCDSCVYTSGSTINNCGVDYTAGFDQRYYQVMIRPDAAGVGIDSKGDYKDTSRSINIQR